MHATACVRIVRADCNGLARFGFERGRACRAKFIHAARHSISTAYDTNPPPLASLKGVLGSKPSRAELLSKVVYGLIMRRRDPGVLHLRI